MIQVVSGSLLILWFEIGLVANDVIFMAWWLRGTFRLFWFVVLGGAAMRWAHTRWSLLRAHVFNWFTLRACSFRAKIAYMVVNPLHGFVRSIIVHGLTALPRTPKITRARILKIYKPLYYYLIWSRHEFILNFMWSVERPWDGHRESAVLKALVGRVTGGVGRTGSITTTPTIIATTTTPNDPRQDANNARASPTELGGALCNVVWRPVAPRSTLELVV